MKKIPALLSILVAAPAFADFYVSGDVTAERCRSFGIKVCSYDKIYAVLENGVQQPFPVGFRSVSDYRKDKGLCSINLRGSDNVKFMTRDKNGTLVVIDNPDSLKFYCIKR